MSKPPRLFVSSPLAHNAQIPLETAQSHYLINVMRRKLHDPILLFNGKDGEWLGQISDAHKKHTSITLKEQTREQAMSPDVTLAFAPVKNVRLDFIAQKATEMGVGNLQPVITEHTIVRKINTDKLRANAIEAAEQCERLDVPNIHEAITLDALLTTHHALIFCDETGHGEPMDKTLATSNQSQATILIGPEGGFSPAEHDALQKAKHATPVTLGPRILRADTAALAALTCWQAACGDWAQKPDFRSA